MSLVYDDLWSVFDARRVKLPELKGLDHIWHAGVGLATNHRPVLKRLSAAADRVEALEAEIKDLGSERFTEEVTKLRDEARVGRLTGALLDRGMALAREAAVRALGMRPFREQIMGALAMREGAIAEMATGEGKTLVAILTAGLWAWEGRPVHVITVNDYLVQRDATEMGPAYKMLGVSTGYVIHETAAPDRYAQYRSGVVYVTSKELVADFLRDQIALGASRTSAQTAISTLISGGNRRKILVPGLWRALVDEADSLLIDEAVTPLIISNSPEVEGNTALYKRADDLAMALELNKDFTIDRVGRKAELNSQGQDHLDQLAEAETGFWRGRRRREELVNQALTARYCFIRGEQYLVNEEQKIQIVDEFTGRVMADRSWRHGLHQAIETKEQVAVTADKDNLARVSFQRFFRQYPKMAGMTGTGWEARGELWAIYGLPIVRIPTHKPCIRQVMPVEMFETIEQKWQAVVDRVCQINDTGAPVLVGTRSVLASEEVSRRLTEKGKPHKVLNATQTAQEASIVAEAGTQRCITVATNMAGRGTDIRLSRGVADLGGLHVIATEPHGSGRVDRQLFGRAARQGDPGWACMYASAEDDLLVRHASMLRKMWQTLGAQRLIQTAQQRAERLARFNRKQVLRSDDWMDQAVPF